MMPDSFPPRPDDDELEQPHNEDEPSGDIPASIAFMEMMRQASARASRNRSGTPANEEEAAANAPPAQPARSKRDYYVPPADEAPPSASSAVEMNAASDEAPSPADVRRVRRRRVRGKRRATLLGGMFRSVIIILVAAGLTAVILTWFTPQALIQEGVRDDLSAAIATSDFATFAPTTQPTPNWLKQIGIVSGHRGPEDDPGAVCQDASGNAIPPTENEINFSVADRVVNSLRALGYSVDLLDEFDPRLNQYQAAALVSIHSNTCAEWPGGEVVSGFLIAGPAARTSMRGNDELLVGCIADHYGNMTGLSRRPGVTIDMTNYHNFREIDTRTPAAIIELGFMRADHDLLVNQPDLMAQAILNGILCFVDPVLAPTRPAPAEGL
ncbi:MAG: N-acetylmuramoyl-L-alanine amidase [Anaerolineae bacterium]|nr:N-acetylmuramoyl-L-alanine amidase [Anaerolineae bacterium]